MRYLKFPLGQQPAGAVAIATLNGVESDVFLVDQVNLARFERQDSFRYQGGHYRRSPVHLTVPTAGNWSIIVIPTGGAVRASVEVRRAA